MKSLGFTLLFWFQRKVRHFLFLGFIMIITLFVFILFNLYLVRYVKWELVFFINDLGTYLKLIDSLLLWRLLKSQYCKVWGDIPISWVKYDCLHLAIELFCSDSNLWIASLHFVCNVFVYKMLKCGLIFILKCCWTMAVE